MYRRARALATCAALGLTLLASVSPQPASASYWGGSWPWSGPGQTVLSLNYVNNTGGDSKVVNNVTYAANDWTNSSTPVAYNSVGSASITVGIVNDPSNQDAGDTRIWSHATELFDQSNGSPCCGSNNYTAATIVLNTYLFDQSLYATGSPASLRERVAEHEFGHAFGLGHSNVASCTNSIMYTPTNYVSYPTSYDGYYTDHLYPSNAWPSPSGSC